MHVGALRLLEGFPGLEAVKPRHGSYHVSRVYTCRYVHKCIYICAAVYKYICVGISTYTYIWFYIFARITLNL